MGIGALICWPALVSHRTNDMPLSWVETTAASTGVCRDQATSSTVLGLYRVASSCPPAGSQIFMTLSWLPANRLPSPDQARFFTTFGSIQGVTTGAGHVGWGFGRGLPVALSQRVISQPSVEASIRPSGDQAMLS